MGFSVNLLSMLAAGFLMVSSGLDTMAPQNHVDGTLFLVNRQWMISAFYEPEVTAAKVKGQVRNMRPDAAAALEEMFAAFRKETKKTMVSVSGYRSYGKQTTIYNRKLQRVKGDVAKAQEYVAPPGSSEHQLGLAMDIGQDSGGGLTEAFGKTEGGRWARENAWRFGFILRYDEPWEEITGYKFEPWHFRYVGKEYARAIHEAGVPLETWLQKYRAEVLLDLLEE